MEMTILEQLEHNHVPTKFPGPEICFKCPVLLWGEYNGAAKLCMRCLEAQRQTEVKDLSDRMTKVVTHSSVRKMYTLIAYNLYPNTSKTGCRL